MGTHPWNACVAQGKRPSPRRTCKSVQVSWKPHYKTLSKALCKRRTSRSICGPCKQSWVCNTHWAGSKGKRPKGAPALHVKTPPVGRQDLLFFLLNASFQGGVVAGAGRGADDGGIPASKQIRRGERVRWGACRDKKMHTCIQTRTRGGGRGSTTLDSTLATLSSEAHGLALAVPSRTVLGGGGEEESQKQSPLHI